MALADGNLALPEVQVQEPWASKAQLFQLALHDATTAYLVLRMLPPRAWWQLRSLSSEWCQLLDDACAGGRQRFGLVRVLVESVGPLLTANDELDFAGCVYRAVHYGSTGPLQQLLRPLAMSHWSRRLFAQAVAREALVQAAVAGDAAACLAVLSEYGPDSPAARSRRNLCREDAVAAMQAAADWHLMSPDDVPETSRKAVVEVLQAVS